MKAIPLTRGFMALVDDEDYERLAQYKWRICPHKNATYAMRTARMADGRERTVQMHREIMEAQPGSDVDHVNRNGLDNRRANLRVCSRCQNLRNRIGRRSRDSKYKGVYQVGKRWRARIAQGGKQYHLGHFDTQEEAAKAYDAAARHHFGEYARLNFPE